ncbi:MAG: AMP-binding protein [Acidobacteria bacterium]|nr:AMP-binding protein [Acidobacteriota bacterium]
MSEAVRSGEEFRGYHDRALRELIRTVTSSNEFYREKMRQVDTKTRDLDGLLKQIPFTIKSELINDQRTNPPYGTNLTYPLAHYNRYHQTSATSGTPMRWLDTPRSWQEILNQWETLFRIWGVNQDDRALFCFSFGPFLGFWSAFESASHLGCLCLPGGGLDTVSRIKMIEDHRVTVICCTPTYALRMGKQAAASRANTSSVRRIFVAGEPGGSTDGVRKQLQTLWSKAVIVDHHGMTEVGPVSYAWPKDPNFLRVIDTAFLAEVVDPQTGEDVAIGERGELVLTTLKRSAMPLIRYRTGDLVERADAEPVSGVSSRLALRGGILGRLDDMVVIRGVNIYPSAIDDIVWSIDGIEEYRVKQSRQNAMNELSLEIEVQPRHEPNQIIHDLEQAFRSAFSMRIPVVSVPQGVLPRFELKARRWVKQ